MGTKVCSKCGEEKALEEFYKDSSKKHGKKSICRVCDKSCNKAYREANKERLREYCQINRERRLERQREYDQSNKDKIREYKREYYRANKERMVKRQIEYNKERRASDPIFALACRCRCRISDALRRKGFSKDTATAGMLGCTYEELMSHLESQFVEGMTWDNMSEWHIDHIVPLASASTKEETVALNHHTNLQPLWAEDNRSKGAKLNWNNCTN